MAAPPGFAAFSEARELLDPTMPFEKCQARLSIASDDASIAVTAHYNPSELAVGKTLPWSTKNEQNDPKASTRSSQDSHEYKGTPARTMALELLFDGYEDGRSVEPIIDLLEVLSTVRDPESPNEELRRPHCCVVVFGEGRDGTPLRAVVNLDLEEARLQSSGAGRAVSFIARLARPTA